MDVWTDPKRQYQAISTLTEPVDDVV